MGRIAESEGQMHETGNGREGRTDGGLEMGGLARERELCSAAEEVEREHVGDGGCGV